MSEYEGETQNDSCKRYKWGERIATVEDKQTDEDEDQDGDGEHHSI